MSSKQTDKFAPPPWVVAPKLENCGLKVMKENKRIQTITEIAQKSYVLFGRNAAMTDIKLEHPSISRRHALIGHGSSGNIYVMDLGSSHGTFVNKQRLKKKKRHPLRDGYIIKFGASTREYIVKLDLDSDDNLDTNQQMNDKTNQSNSRKRKLDKTTNEKDTQPNAKKAKTEKVSCRHLLVKHEGSRRPKSWKSDTITRSKQEAIEIILKYREEIMKGIETENENETEIEQNGDIDKQKTKQMTSLFMNLAKKHSDCNSYKRGGDLGAFGRGRMQKPFENAAFALNIGQLSDPVETDSGIHLIVRYA